MDHLDEETAALVLKNTFLEFVNSSRDCALPEGSRRRASSGPPPVISSSDASASASSSKDASRSEPAAAEKDSSYVETRWSELCRSPERPVVDNEARITLEMQGPVQPQPAPSAVAAAARWLAEHRQAEASATSSQVVDRETMHNPMDYFLVPPNDMSNYGMVAFFDQSLMQQFLPWMLPFDQQYDVENYHTAQGSATKAQKSSKQCSKNRKVTQFKTTDMPLAAKTRIPHKGAQTDVAQNRPSADCGSSSTDAGTDSDRKSEGSSDDHDVSSRTTVMLRNLPNNYSRDMLLELLNQQGFAGKYDFLYLPMDFGSTASLGYAFVNLVSAVDVPQFWKTFEGFSEWVIPTKKHCKISWSHPVQGLQSNLDRYRNSPVMHPDVPDAYKPARFDCGARVQFPPPTKKLKLPRLRSMTVHS